MNAIALDPNGHDFLTALGDQTVAAFTMAGFSPDGSYSLTSAPYRAADAVATTAAGGGLTAIGDRDGFGPNVSIFNATRALVGSVYFGNYYSVQSNGLT